MMFHFQALMIIVLSQLLVLTSSASFRTTNYGTTSTQKPSANPTKKPSVAPSNTAAPTSKPTVSPTQAPSAPTKKPTSAPSVKPNSAAPTVAPTHEPVTHYYNLTFSSATVYGNNAYKYTLLINDHFLGNYYY
jgi:hypothetical protein